jgi:hypothetical protein
LIDELDGVIVAPGIHAVLFEDWGGTPSRTAAPT